MGSSGGIITSSDPGDSVASPGSSVDRSVVRFSGVFGDEILDSLFIVSDGGEGSGLTRLDVDNLRIDGNTISSVNVNGDLVLDPNGSGRVLFGADGGFGINADGDFTLAGAANSGFSRLRLKGGASFSAGTAGALKVQSDDGATNWLRLDNAGIRLRADGQFGFVAASDPDSGVDTGIVRNAAGVILDTNGSSGLGAHLTGRVVEASVAGIGTPNLLAVTESRKLITNEGATAEAYNSLPTSAPIGCEIQLYCADSDGIRLTAPTGETIRTGPGAVSATGGFIRSTVIGSGITLVKINSTSWVAVNAPNGTWTIDT